MATQSNMAPVSTTTMSKKDYFIFTDSRVSGHFIENFGDRAFYLRRSRQGGFRMEDSWLINGDPLWEINEANLTNIAKATFDNLLKEEKEQREAEKPKRERQFGSPGNRPKWCCQDCGVGIGYLGRWFQWIFGKTHNCQ